MFRKIRPGSCGHLLIDVNLHTKIGSTRFLVEYLFLFLSDLGSRSSAFSDLAAPAQRTEQIGRIGMDVDWCFAECLARGREEILDACVPILEGANLARHS